MEGEREEEEFNNDEEQESKEVENVESVDL